MVLDDLYFDYLDFCGLLFLKSTNDSFQFFDFSILLLNFTNDAFVWFYYYLLNNLFYDCLCLILNLVLKLFDVDS